MVHPVNGQAVDFTPDRPGLHAVYVGEREPRVTRVPIVGWLTYERDGDPTSRQWLAAIHEDGNVLAADDLAGLLRVIGEHDPDPTPEEVDDYLEWLEQRRHRARPVDKPTELMAQAAAELERSPIPLTLNALRALIRSDRPKLVSEAIARLIVEGYVRERPRGRAPLLELVRPYPDLEEAPRAR